jgi:hypothetical protein
MNQHSKKSTNGRWGISLVASGLDEDALKRPIQGTIRHLGNVAGFDTWEVSPCESGEWYWLADDVEVVGGAVVLSEMGLQSNGQATLMRLSAEAVVKSYGYKRRSSRYVALVNGERRDIPDAVLAAMGLVQGSGVREADSLPKPEPLQGAMAAAFAKLKG